MTHSTSKTMSDNKHKQKPNSSYAGASVLLGVSAETIDICMPMMKYLDSLNSQDKEIFKKAAKNGFMKKDVKRSQID